MSLRGLTQLRWVLLVALYITKTYAQLPAYTWLTPLQQPQIKISVDHDGIYKVTGEALTATGWNISEFDPTNLQMFHHGKEVAVFIDGGGDGRFDPTDFLLFYGKKNDGNRDSLMYRNAERANPFHSLYGDESAYFLTIGNQRGKRMDKTFIAQPDQGITITPETFHLERQTAVFTDQFSFNNSIGLVPLLQQSYFERGEGRTGIYITSDSVATLPINFANRVQGTGYQLTTTFRINGRSRVFHTLNVGIGPSPETRISVDPFGFTDTTFTIQEKAIQNERINLTFAPVQKQELDWYSLTFAKTMYPQKTLLGGASSKYFYLPRTANKHQAVILPDLSKSGMVWNVTDQDNPVFTHLVNGAYVAATATAPTVLFATQQPEFPAKTASVTLLKNLPVATDYLIITHASLLESAKEYADYRRSDAGGSYTPLIVTTQELYDSFNYGERSPVALRKFCEHMLATAKPKQLLLLGQGVSFPDELRTETYPDLVPTFGYPGSDILITSGLANSLPDVPSISTGRLNVTQNAEVRAYLDKVKTTEAIRSPQAWQKKIMHLSGGKSPLELTLLRSILANVEPTVTRGLLGGDVEVRAKKTDVEIEPIDISPEVNGGLGMVTFAGHGSANVIDLNIGYCSPPQNGFANEGKYPIMFFNGCGVGNVFYRYNPLSTDWLLAPKKGAVAVFANSFWSYAYPTQRYLEVLYEKLFNDPETVQLTLGEIQQAVSQTLSNEATNDYIKANIHQMILQGDPALRVFPISKPDYAISDNSIFISAKNESQLIAQNDSLRVGVVVQNKGRYEKGQRVKAVVKKQFADNTTAELAFAIDAVALRDTVYVSIKKETTLTSLQVIIDPANDISELVEENNSGRLIFNDWTNIEQKTSFPDNILPDRLAPNLSVKVNGKLLTNNDLIPKNTAINFTLTDNNPLTQELATHLTALLKSCETCDFEPIQLTQTSPSGTAALEAMVQFQQLPAGTYTLLANGRDAAGNATASAYQINFNVAETPQPTEVVIFPNPGGAFVQIWYFITDVAIPAEGIVTVYNVNGQWMNEQRVVPSVGENSLFLETGHLPPGRYLVKLALQNGEEIISKSFIKR